MYRPLPAHHPHESPLDAGRLVQDGRHVRDGAHAPTGLKALQIGRLPIRESLGERPEH
jgi:hypothetical protein